MQSDLFGAPGDINIEATLRKFADIAEAGEKPHWAGAMRLAATEIRQLRELIAEAVALRPFWPFPLTDEAAKKRDAVWQRMENYLPPNAELTGRASAACEGPR